MQKNTRADTGGTIGAIASLKPTKETLFGKIVYNSVNSIHDTSFEVLCSTMRG